MENRAAWRGFWTWRESNLKDNSATPREIKDLTERLIPCIEERYGLDLRDKEDQLAQALLNHFNGDSRRILSASEDLDQLCALAANVMTVGETYFMRHREALEEFIRQLICMGPVNIWCAACSSGEEAYSMAFILNRLGVHDFSIVGSDVNPSAIGRARKGVYGRWSLRGLKGEEHLLLQQLPGGFFSVRDQYRKNVLFVEGNVLHPPKGPFSGISCRNLFIYFSEHSIGRALDVFYGVLKPRGILMVGPTEAPWVSMLRRDIFRPAGVSMFSRVDPIAEGGSVSIGAIAPATKGPSAARSKELVEPAAGLRGPLPRTCNSIDDPGRRASYNQDLPVDTKALDVNITQYIRAIRHEADRGNLEKAEEELKRAKAAFPDSAELRLLEGMIFMDMGMYPQAHKALQGAVYLNPSIPEAHFALMNLALGDGDMATAKRHGRLLLNALGDRPDTDPTVYGHHVTAGQMRRSAERVLEE